MNSRIYLFEDGVVVVPNAEFLSADDIWKNEEELGDLKGVKYRGQVIPVSLNDWRGIL